MRKNILWLLTLACSIAFGQDMKNFKLYNPDENAISALSKSVKDAKANGKNVVVQIGGNWCVWCARFNELVTKDKQIDSVVTSNFIVYHLNYSPENRNKELLAKFGYPQRFGFPVFIVLDGDGNKLHIQNSAYLEEGKGYNKEKVIEFFENWSPKALDPKQYKDY